MTLLDFLRPIHIVAGSLSLISGVVAMTSKKGKPIHRLAGKVFFWSMTTACALGLNAGIFRSGYLIFIPIALISFYQVASGYRILYIKNLHNGGQAALVDWLLTIGMSITTFAFIGWGVMSLQTDIFLSIVLFSFSAIGMYCCGVDLYHYIKKPTHKNYWLFIHIFRMSHGFIAALTAFLVNNSKLFPFLPQVLLLIIPISIGQPLVTYVIWTYRRKNGKAEPVITTVRI
jgi:uncharacterized membrane protein